ncbi:unnamed protein product [Calicophoron daubneyi]|uniref:Cathepsin B-like cysteine proteinase n=1 Tax=Calicophoron daubneyi TaxID=300641 RepID=A0AAV2TJP9_CALDB
MIGTIPNTMRTLWLLVISCLVISKISALSGDRVVEHVDLKTGAKWLGRKSSRFNSVDEMRMMLGARRNPPDVRKKYPVVDRRPENGEPLPDEFDARKRWPNCKSIGMIRDQSSCGSCWAFAAASTMSDHYCIQTGKSVLLSETDLLSCCTDCGHGCQGGWDIQSWDYWNKTGLVTGSGQDCEGCRCYPFMKCKHHGTKGDYPPCPEKLYSTPECENKCRDGYPKKFAEDKIFGNAGYYVAENEKAIMSEIKLNGPVQAYFAVFEDFMDYDSGVYFHSHGDLLGYHAIRIIGWGHDRDVPYWVIANSWNEKWGENGTFRMLRGFDECKIEEHVVSNSK